MAERGNKKNRFIDKYVGIPLTIPAHLIRRVDKPKKNGSDKAAIICLGAIGDLLLVSGLINSIRGRFKQIDLYTSMANASSASFLANVDNVYSYPLSKLPAMISTIRRERYDILLDTTQWARVGALVSALSKAGVTVGFSAKGEYRSLPYDIRVRHDKSIHEWKNFYNLGLAALRDTVPCEPSICVPESGFTENLRNILPKNPFVVLHMWALGSHAGAREWPAEKWAELIGILNAGGYDVALTGSKADRIKTEEFIACFALDKCRVHNVAGSLTLPEVGGLIAKSEGVVSINTGIMHMAALLGAKTIGMHGPTNPVRWGPVGRHAYTLTHDGVNSFPDMELAVIEDDRSFTRRIEVAEVTEAMSCLGIIRKKY